MNLLKSYLWKKKCNQVQKGIKKIIFPGILGILLITNIVIIEHNQFANKTNVVEAEHLERKADYSYLRTIPVDTYLIKDNYWQAQLSFDDVNALIAWLNHWEYDLCSLKLEEGIYELEIGAEFSWLK